MNQSLRRRWLHWAFIAGIILKGIDGVAELLAGGILLVVGKQTIVQTVLYWTHGELIEDPADLVANYLVHTAHGLSTDTRLFIAAYLLGHGAVKIVLVTALLHRRMWAYPAMLVVLLAFIAYQAYRLSHQFSIALVLLTVVDAVVGWLVWLEYRRLRSIAA